MGNIKDILENFLADQDVRLKSRTYKKYKEVIQLFEDYLNGYAYNHLSDEDYDIFEKKFNEQDKNFCEIFTLNKIGEEEVNEFLTYFMIKKVMGGKELMKNSGTVMRKFVNWLKDNSYVNEDKFDRLYETVNDVKKDLPKVAELSDLLYDNGVRNSIYQYDEYEEDNFRIVEVKSEELWLEGYIESENKIGPVIVPEKVSNMAEAGWTVYIELGKRDDKWYVLGSGNVYPY